MVGLRTLCVLQLVVVACFAVDTQAFDGATELVQVLESSKPQDALPENMDQMKAMIDSAMSETEKADIGEMNSDSAKADMEVTMDKIAEKQAIADEMEAEKAKDCVLSQWSKWTECDAKCDGGSTKRTRKIISTDQNGGKACPMNDDGTPFVEESASCNTESCAKEAREQADKLRHMTQDEIEKESAKNKKIEDRAMNANTVEDMKREMRHWIDRNVKTKTVVVRLPGEGPQTDEEAVQPLLKAAIAKNTVNTAMEGFEAAQKKDESKDN